MEIISNLVFSQDHLFATQYDVLTALNFLKQSIQEGTIIILDDFFHTEALSKSVADATYEFMKK